MSEPVEDDKPLVFSNFGDEVSRDMNKKINKFAELLEKMNTPGLPPQVDLTIVDNSNNLKESKIESTTRNTRSKRKLNEASGCMIVQPSNSSSEKTVEKSKNKRRAKNNVPVLLNPDPIEIKESDDEKEKVDDISTDIEGEELPLKEELINHEVSVKVIWKSVHTHRFKMRKYQKMKYIFDYFNKLESIDENKLFFVVHGKMIYPDDTPESLELSIIDFIDGGEVRTPIDYNEPRSPKKIDNDSIEFKILVRNLKKPIFMRIKKTDQMIILMIKVAEQLDLPLKRLKFSFDGDIMKGRDTVTELDMEGGECIEVAINN